MQRRVNLTVREALNFGGLYGASVVAGIKGLDKPIQSISVLEITESQIEQWMLQNQLYITSFYAIFDNKMKQLQVVKALIEAGCSGLVLCYIGTWVQQIDEEIIRVCDTNKFPLIQARTDVSYIEILNPIIQFLHSGNKKSEVKGTSCMPQEVLDIIVNEDEVNTIFRKIDVFFGTQVAYFDTYGKEIYSDYPLKVTERLRKYVLKFFNQLLLGCSKNGYSIQAIDGKDWLVGLICSQKQTFGLFITECCSENQEDIKEQFIDPLVICGALTLKRRNRMEELRNKAIEDYAVDLLMWNFPSSQKAVERGVELSLFILDKAFMILVNINSIQSSIDSKTQQDIQAYIKKVILPQLDQTVKSLNEDNWLSFQSDMILIFVHKTVDEVALENYGKRIFHIFEQRTDLSVSIGISERFSEVSEIPRAYSEAFTAATLGRKFYGENKCVFFKEIYFFQVFKNISDDKETNIALNYYLLPLQMYDKTHGTSLEKTLQVLLKENGNTLNAANLLYVHKNTVLQRRQKIMELLHFDPLKMPYRQIYEIVYTILEIKENSKLT